MKLVNSTDIPDYALRRIISWCCRFHGLPVSYLREAVFRNRGDNEFTGCCYGRRIVMSIGRMALYVTETDELIDRPATIDERIDGLVGVTAHEVFHSFAAYKGINSRRHGRGRNSSEPQTKWHERKALEAFRSNRDALMAEWFAEPQRKARAEKPSLQEQRAMKVASKLAEWELKLKRAQSKVREYRKKMRYYEKAIAAKRKSD